MIIKFCQHPVEQTNSFKSSKLKQNLELHQKELTELLRKPFEPKFIKHIVVEETMEDII